MTGPTVFQADPEIVECEQTSAEHSGTISLMNDRFVWQAISEINNWGKLAGVFKKTLRSRAASDV